MRVVSSREKLSEICLAPKEILRPMWERRALLLKADRPDLIDEETCERIGITEEFRREPCPVCGEPLATGGVGGRRGVLLKRVRAARCRKPPAELFGVEPRG
jgi:hypothetical protein